MIISGCAFLVLTAVFVAALDATRPVQATADTWVTAIMTIPRNPYIGRSNTNSLTLGAHQVLASWIDSQANWNQRQSGVNWQAAGMGSGSDYAAAADGSVDVLGNGGSWVELDVSDMAQAWVNNAADNKGVVVLQEAASGSVIYSFCSELGWSPCTAAQAPKLTIWYRQ